MKKAKNSSMRGSNARAYQAAPAVRPPIHPKQGWKCAQAERSIIWWDAAQIKDQDGRVQPTRMRRMVALFLVLFAVVGLPVWPVLLILVFDLKEMAVVALTLLGLLLAAACWGLLDAMEQLFRFEVDLDAQRITLHYTCFPNRTIITRVSFFAIDYLRLRRMKSQGPVGLELVYLNGGGKRVTVALYGELYGLDEGLLHTQLEWLRPALGAKILPMVAYDC